MKETLKQDHAYYGEEGKAYLSNSDIDALIKNPKKFKAKSEDDKAFAMGRYFHQLMLEPEKAAETPMIDVSTRGTKTYKEAAGDDKFILLTNEAIEVQSWVDTIKSNYPFYEAIYDSANKFEEPSVCEIAGEMWKGKADIVTPTNVIDLKTTGDITSFRWNAKKYNYDSQAYIYSKLFGKPLLFYAIDKETLMLGVFTPSRDFLESGKAKVEKAVENYRKFFGEGANESLNDYYITEVI